MILFRFLYLPEITTLISEMFLKGRAPHIEYKEFNNTCTCRSDCMFDPRNSTAIEDCINSVSV